MSMAEEGQTHPLVDYTATLEEDRRGRSCIHVHLSRLRPGSRTPDRLRMAAESFDKVERQFAGKRFLLENGDIILFLKQAKADEVDSVVLRLRHLFSEDPLFSGKSDDTTRFSTWFNLVTEYRALINQMKNLRRYKVMTPDDLEAAEERKQAEKAGELLLEASGKLDGAGGAGPAPLHPSQLKPVVDKLASLDVSAYIRRQFICLINGIGSKPRPVFSEIFLSIGDINRQLTVQMTSDKWLFQYLTHFLDQRMLTFLTTHNYNPASKAFSLNINVASLLSPTFKKLDERLSDAVKRTVMFELQAMDIYSDMGAFVFARDFLRDKGYKISVDGLSPLTMPFVNRRALGLDLMKIYWTSDMKETSAGRQEQLQQLVTNAGAGRVILCRCDDEEAVLYGMNLGITLFQGRYLDFRLGQRTGV